MREWQLWIIAIAIAVAFVAYGFIIGHGQEVTL